MSRTRKSARQAGTRFERIVADYLAANLDDRIDRRVRTGAKDRGDLAGVRHMGERVTVECKDVARLNLAGWASEAECERGNDDGCAWLIVHKRHGRAAAGEQWVTTTLEELVALLTGSRAHTAEHGCTAACTPVEGEVQ